MAGHGGPRRGWGGAMFKSVVAGAREPPEVSGRDGGL